MCFLPPKEAVRTPSKRTSDTQGDKTAEKMITRAKQEQPDRHASSPASYRPQMISKRPSETRCTRLCLDQPPKRLLQRHQLSKSSHVQLPPARASSKVATCGYPCWPVSKAPVEIVWQTRQGTGRPPNEQCGASCASLSLKFASKSLGMLLEAVASREASTARSTPLPRGLPYCLSSCSDDFESDISSRKVAMYSYRQQGPLARELRVGTRAGLCLKPLSKSSGKLVKALAAP